MKLEFEITPNPLAAARGLDRLAELMTGRIAMKIHEKAGILYQEHVTRHLDSEGSATGPEFVELTKRYADSKPPGLPILERSGKMRKALLRIRASPKALVGGPRGGKIVRTKLAVHLRGSPRTNLPARPPFRADMDPSGGERTNSPRVTLGQALLQISIAELRDASRRVRPRVLRDVGMRRASSDPRRFTTR